MRRDILLVLLTATGSALWWWPVIMEPSLDLPWWPPLAFVAVPILAGLSATLSGERWLLILVASAAGTFAGMCVGYAIWWPADGIEASYVPLLVAVGTLAEAVVSLVAALVGRKIRVPNEKYRRTIWAALVCCVAFGPVAVALTPPLVAKRVVRNDRLAAGRFEALRVAVEQTSAEPGGVARICDGKTLKQHYSGPPFSDTDWRYIAGNSVREDGYYFGIWIDCPQPDAYVVEAAPIRQEGDGTRRFCADSSGMIGCGLGTHEECLPCAK